MAQEGGIATLLHSRRLGRVLAVVMTLVVALSALVGLSCTPEQVMELELMAGLNRLRVEQGLPPLPPDPVLSSVARLRAEDMAAKDYFSHDPPDGCNYRCLLQREGTPAAAEHVLC